MPLYRNKPIVVEAEQCFFNKLPYPKGVKTRYVDPIGIIHFNVTPGIVGIDCQLIVNTKEGDMIVNNGDWIITGIQGEIYPCKPDIFEATYQIIEPPPNFE